MSVPKGSLVVERVERVRGQRSTFCSKGGGLKTQPIFLGTDPYSLNVHLLINAVVQAMNEHYSYNGVTFGQYTSMKQVDSNVYCTFMIGQAS